MTIRPEWHVRVQVLATGETGHVNPDRPATGAGRVLHLDIGGTRILGGNEQIRSAEPLLGPLDDIDLDGIDWLIAGGESGPGARPMDLNWVRGLRNACAASGVALFVKQLGSHWEAAAGRRGKGGDMQYWPADLRIREYPDALGAEVAA
jgi:hypothetical protein